MLLENPVTYLTFAESTWSEVDFIGEVVRRTGCGLLLDVNNVHVAATNQEWDALDYIQTFPLAHVREIHLAGHAREVEGKGRPLLIDSHDPHVDATVWALYRYALERLAPVPTLIEWDANVPDWPVLHTEAHRAETIMREADLQEERQLSQLFHSTATSRVKLQTVFLCSCRMRIRRRRVGHACWLWRRKATENG